MTQFKATTRRKNDRQFIWDYMRRNRIFKIDDLLTIVDEMSMESMMVFFNQLERAGYVKVRIPAGKNTKPKRFKDRSYGFIKNTGALCPVWIQKQKRLYDRNTQKLQIKDVSMKLPVEVNKRSELRPVDRIEYNKGRITQILKSEPDGLIAEELMDRSGLTQSDFSAAYAQMLETGETAKNGLKIYLKERKNAS